MKQEDIRNLLSQIIHDARVQKGLTREELARQVHAHVTSVTAWENGASIPHEKKRILLSEALGIEIVDLEKLRETDTISGSHNIDFVHGSEVTAKTLEYSSDIINSSNNCINIARINNMNIESRNQLRPYYNMMFEVLKNHNITINIVECVYDKNRVKEILHNIILLDEYKFYIKVFNYYNRSNNIPMIDFYMCDNSKILFSSYSTSRNVYEKPKLFVQDETISAFFNNYWATVWDLAAPLNYLGAQDLSGIRSLAREFDILDDEFEETLMDAERAKLENTAKFLI